MLKYLRNASILCALVMVFAMTANAAWLAKQGTDGTVSITNSDNSITAVTIDAEGDLSSIDMDGGSIDGVTIGATVSAPGTFSTLVAVTADINGGTVDGATIGATTSSTVNTTSLVAVTADINAGTIDGATIGATTSSTVNTTSLVAVTADINAGTIDGTTIGATVSAAVTTSALVAVTADINAGTLDGVTLGGSSAGAATVTNFTATGTLDVRDVVFSTAVAGNPFAYVHFDDVTLAELNSTHVVLAATAAADLRLHTMQLAAYGSDMSALTAVVLECTGGTDILSIPLANLTENTVIGPYTSGTTYTGTLVTDCPTGEGIQLTKTGSAGTGSTGVRLDFTYSWQ